MSAKQILAMALCVFAVAGCSGGRDVMPFAVLSGPDEFALVPYKPLSTPTDFSTLPTPTPQGTNLADATPKADAIALLGGRLPQTGVDGTVVTYASRYGVDPDIRTTLADADARLQGRSVFALGKYPYERRYQRFALDPYEEWARLRDLGVTVPSAPAQ